MRKLRHGKGAYTINTVLRFSPSSGSGFCHGFLAKNSGRAVIEPDPTRSHTRNVDSDLTVNPLNQKNAVGAVTEAPLGLCFKCAQRPQECTDFTEQGGRTNAGLTR